MNDNDKLDASDEYHFVDEPDMGGFDNYEAQSESEQSTKTPPASEPKQQNSLQLPPVLSVLQPIFDILKQNFLLRTGLIVIAILGFSLVIYKCTMNPLAVKSKEKLASIPVEHPKAMVEMPKQEVHVDNVIPTPVKVEQVIPDKLSVFEKSQANLQAQVTALANQLTTVNSNVSAMMGNMKALNDQLDQLASAVRNEAKLTAGLAEQMKEHQNKVLMARRINVPMQKNIQYALQAVIPGRAWLLSSEGQTLTVREGSRIANYGTVRYIDARRGRVLTSSGQVITFSQEDS